jgi:hypothetical protein
VVKCLTRSCAPAWRSISGTCDLGEWASYSLQDMLLFSGRVYFRQFELANEFVWPAQIVLIAAGLFAAFAVWRGEVRLVRLAATLLALGVAVSAWVYLHKYYSEINWAAAYMVPVFVVQAVLLLAAAARPLGIVQRQGVRRVAAMLLVGVVAGYPLAALVAGRSSSAAEVFGIAADPTMLAALVFVAVWQSRWRWALAVVPVVWCLFSILTLHTMGSEQYLLVSGVALAGFGIMAMRRTFLA